MTDIRYQYHPIPIETDGIDFTNRYQLYPMVYIYIYVYIYIHTYIYIYTYIHTSTYIYI